MSEQNGLTVQQKALQVGSRGVQLTSFEDAWRFSQAVVLSGFAPPGYKTAQQVLIAVQRGAEVGLPPMQALDVIAVINGRPTVYGDGIPALVEAAGVLADAQEWIDGEGDARTAHCKVLRKGQQTPLERTFSVADAKRAKLWGKAGPWQQYPDRMLTMRARAFAYRDKFADCLRGLQVREEVEDFAPAIPGEVIEPDRPRRLSEIPDPDGPPRRVTDLPEADDGEPVGESYDMLREAIEALPDGASDDERNALYGDLGCAKSEGRLSEAEHADLLSMLGQRVAF